MKFFNHHRFTGAILLALLVSSLTSFADAKQSKAVEGTQYMVATLLQQRISYSQIRVSDQTALASFEMRDLSNSDKLKALPTIKHQLELTRLSSLIYKITFAHLIRKYAIRANNAEVANLSKKNNVDFAAEAKELRRKNQLLLQALKMLDQGQNEVDVYHKLLSKEMPLDMWVANIPFYKSERGRKFVLLLSRVTAKEQKDAWDKALVESIQSDKLSDEIDRQIAVKDITFKSELRYSIATSTPYEQRIKSKQYVNLRRADWWRSFYRRTLFVADKQFADVFKMLK